MLTFQKWAFRRLSIAVVLLFGLCAVFAWLVSVPPAAADDTVPAASKQPEAVFPEMTYNFGTVMAGTTVKHEFVIENKGKTTLTIKNVRTD
ncbi:MAG: DUF1573 domain-containing protein [Desulfatitalea sp.]|nr:DUF1573 domain-containing protein [Desulfatitalea sp.]NNJ99147.1 DUF1573 domain-containing protein [Desulfatitalea sp.]